MRDESLCVLALPLLLFLILFRLPLPKLPLCPSPPLLCIFSYPSPCDAIFVLQKANPHRHRTEWGETPGLFRNKGENTTGRRKARSWRLWTEVWTKLPVGCQVTRAMPNLTNLSVEGFIKNGTVAGRRVANQPVGNGPNGSRYHFPLVEGDERVSFF
ncbi:hypothetical protein BX600DRAFT_95798 [Xylariales sp. PMI_506]|nr:hypothetical protein BX600DRAFT_95798 [Xylariales sp. PMI_506]